MSSGMKDTLLKVGGFIFIIALGVVLYYGVQQRSNVSCTVDPGSISFTPSAADEDPRIIAEEIFAKYLEAHHIGNVCSDRVISGYKIDSVAIRRASPESIIATAVFDVSPLDSSGSSWLLESAHVENLYVQDLERDFIIQKENKEGAYSILDVISDQDPPTAEL